MHIRSLQIWWIKHFAHVGCAYNKYIRYWKTAGTKDEKCKVAAADNFYSSYDFRHLRDLCLPYVRNTIFVTRSFICQLSEYCIALWVVLFFVSAFVAFLFFAFCFFCFYTFVCIVILCRKMLQRCLCMSFTCHSLWMYHNSV